MVNALGSNAIGASSGSNGNNAMAVLQKKMGDLMKQLRDAAKDTSPGSEERLKLLKILIQAVQLQIQQLQSTAAQKAALEQLKLQQELTATADAEKAKSKSNDSTVGSVVDTIA